MRRITAFVAGLLVAIGAAAYGAPAHAARECTAHAATTKTVMAPVSYLEDQPLVRMLRIKGSWVMCRHSRIARPNQNIMFALADGSVQQWGNVPGNRYRLEGGKRWKLGDTDGTLCDVVEQPPIAMFVRVSLWDAKNQLLARDDSRRQPWTEVCPPLPAETATG
jgi:hypothetical protein